MSLFSLVSPPVSPSLLSPLSHVFILSLLFLSLSPLLPPVSPQGSFYVPSENCLQRAHTWHGRLCRLLLVAHRGLRSYYTSVMKEIPQLDQVDIGETTTCYNSISSLFSYVYCGNQWVGLLQWVYFILCKAE